MQQGKSKIELIRDYFMNCPLLKDGKLNIDYVGEEPIQYSINTMLTSNSIVKQYTDGGTLRQYPFVFVSNEIYSQDAIDQIEACGFYDKLEEWIEKQDAEENLPKIEGIQSIEVMAPGYLFDASQTVARYQIQCRILYEKEAI